MCAAQQKERSKATKLAEYYDKKAKCTAHVAAIVHYCRALVVARSKALTRASRTQLYVLALNTRAQSSLLAILQLSRSAFCPRPTNRLRSAASLFAHPPSPCASVACAAVARAASSVTQPAPMAQQPPPPELHPEPTAPLPEGEHDPDDHPADPADVSADDSSSDEALLSLPDPAAVPDEDASGSASAGGGVSSFDDDALCVVCFESPPETTLEPCGHANLCLTCLSRLAKRRCPTCRARAKKVRVVDAAGIAVVRAVKEVINDRKRQELDVLSSTLQIVFLGPPDVGKRSLVRKLLARFPLDPTAAPTAELSDEELFSDGTDFSANSRMAGTPVRLSVLRRATLASRRMMLDDVRVLKPDVLILCCAAHAPSTFDDMLSWDRVLRSGFPRSRVWALLAAENEADGDLSMADAAGFHINKSVHASISAISPAETRPRGHYLCAHGPEFNIGFRSLAKDVVSIARLARDEQLATALAAEEAHNLAVQHAAGNLGADQSDAANLVMANNGIPLPAYATGGMHMHLGAHMHMASRAQTVAGRPGDAARTPFGLRGLRARENASGFSLAGLVNWFSGASGDAH